MKFIKQSTNNKKIISEIHQAIKIKINKKIFSEIYQAITHYLTHSIRDSETFIDFVQGPPGSRRERVKIA